MAEFPITEIIAVHEDPNVDLALFRIPLTSSAGEGAPQPLPLAGDPSHSVAQRPVYVIGYPAWDGHRNDPEIMGRIFSNIYNVKRLQPGQILAERPPSPLFYHDCSTLGGNSGSCIVDLQTHQVLGLHFRGRFRQANGAVRLSELRQDRLIWAAGLNYV